jgi:hypothetical protein
MSVLTLGQKTTEFWRKIKSKEAPHIKGLPPSSPEYSTSPLFSSSGHLILSASFPPKKRSPNGVLYAVPSMEERLQEKREENKRKMQVQTQLSVQSPIGVYFLLKFIIFSSLLIRL